MSLLVRTVLLAAGATAIAVGAGWMLALAWLRSGRGLRAGLAGAALATLALPPFLVANAWLGFVADVRSALGVVPDAALYAWVAVLLGLLYWPITAILSAGALARVDASLLEWDPRFRGMAFLRHLVWPMVRPATGIAAAITFVLAAGSFTLPVLFQVPVFTEVMWIRFNTRLDALGAFRAAIPLVLVSLAVVLGLRGRPVAWPRPGAAASGRLWARALGGSGVACAAAAAGVVVLGLLLPLGDLFMDPRTWRELPGALAAGRGALRASVALASAGTLGVLAVAIVLATARRGPVRRPGLLWILFLVPGILLAIGMLQFLNRPGFRWLHPGPGVPWMAVVLRYLAPMWAAVAAAVAAVDPAWTELVRTGGGRWRDLWRRVWIPGAGRSMAAAAAAVHVLLLWDVETVVLLAPPGGETLALRVFNLLHYGHAGQVNALCLVLIGVALVPVALGALALRAGAGWGRRIAAGAGMLAVAVSTVGCRPAAVSRTAPLDSVLFAAVEVIGSRGVAPGQFNKPRSVVCDRDDNLYVADLTGRIQRFDPEGRFVLQWQMPETDLGKPKGLGLDPEGNILVVEPHYMRVNHFRPDGTRVAQWGRRGTNAGEFILPRGIAVGPQGEYFLSEYTVVDRVQRFAAGIPADGAIPRLLGSWGRAGLEPGNFNRAENLDVDREGRVFVADSCNHRIQVFTSDGRLLRMHGGAGSDPGRFSYPYDVRVDRSGTQFVCEFGNSRITVLDAEDRVVEVIGRAGMAPGEFANPWSVALNSRGDLYVADSQNHRVQKLVRRHLRGTTEPAG